MDFVSTRNCNPTVGLAYGAIDHMVKLSFLRQTPAVSASGDWALIYSLQVAFLLCKATYQSRCVETCGPMCQDFFQTHIMFPATAITFSLNFKVHLAEVNRYNNHITFILKASIFGAYLCPPKVDLFYLLISLKRKGGMRCEEGTYFLFDEF